MDNTPDADKPLSGPQLAALNARVGDNGAPVDTAGRWFYQGVEVVWGVVDPVDGGAVALGVDGYLRGKLPLLAGANGVQISEGADGLWRIGLGTEPGQLPLDGGQVIDTSAPRWFQGRKVVHAVASTDEATGLVLCEDGSAALGDGDVQEARTETLYFEGDPVEKAEADRNGRTWQVRLADGRTRINLDARDLAPFLPESVAPRIWCFGDSLTVGAGGGGVTWPTVLAGLTGLEVIVDAIGSTTSKQITMRAGAALPRVTVSGDQIVSGANTITVIDGVTLAGMAADNDQPFPLSGANDNTTRTVTAVLQGVTGTLRRTSSGGPPSTSETYTFTPVAGSILPVTCPPQSPLRIIKDIRAGDIVVVWQGRNDNTEPDQIKENNRRMVALARSVGAHVMVLTVINGNYALERKGGARYQTFVDLAADTMTEFPVETLDIRRLLISQGLSRAGITPTAQDLIDIADDIVPESLRSDNIHGNASFYTIVAEAIHEHLIARGLVAA